MASPDASWRVEQRVNGSAQKADHDADHDGEEGVEEEPRGVCPDSAWARIRHGWPGAAWVTNPTLRRFQGWELLIVLGIFPLGSALVAVVALTEQLQNPQAAVNSGIPGVNGAWLAAGFGAFDYLIKLAAPALVFYLLIRSREGIESINLGGRRLRMDLALLLPVFIVVQSIPQHLGTGILSALHLHGFLLSGPSPAFPRGPLTAELAVASVVSGIVEEVVVLGFLVRRLEQRGYSAVAVATIAVVVRVCYHLYYGWNVLPIVLWAIATVLVYQRIRRLLPFIICHVLWDIEIPFRNYFHGFFLVTADLIFLALLVMMVIWIRWVPDEDRVHVAASSPMVGPAWTAAMSASGWYPDPLRRYQWRYWDGQVWSGHVANDGLLASDPLG
jgi:hypothetical protein